MPWESKTVEKIREEFVLSAQRKGNFAQLCREFGITRKTGYKWLERYVNGEKLCDQSRSPRKITNKTPEEVETLILKLRDENPGWGGKTLKCVLENQGNQNIPCAKTITNLLNRNGRISPEESLKHKPFIRFEKEKSNIMWQTDFKEEFLMEDHQYCYPLTILDDHSRFSIQITPHISTGNVVISSFKCAFQQFGLPSSVLSDNGAQFAGFKKGYTQFEKWLMNQDILPIHGRIRHPQTQGKIERFHGTMKRELLNHEKFLDLAHADLRLQQWREKYNTQRPHEALGMRTPAEAYEPSCRQYVDEITPYEYGGQFHVIRVNSWGYVRFHKWQVYLSETMVGELIEFRESQDGETFCAFYRNFKIAEFSTQTGHLIHRGISRC